MTNKLTLQQLLKASKILDNNTVQMDGRIARWQGVTFYSDASFSYTRGTDYAPPVSRRKFNNWSLWMKNIYRREMRRGEK